MSVIESYFHEGEGYDPFLIRDGWQVAQLNFLPRLAPTSIRLVERHRDTDEAFVLFRGTSILFAATETPDGLEFEICPMRPSVTYNIPAGVWHSIAMSPEDLVMIVEKSQTHLRDVEMRSLSPTEYERLQSTILGKVDEP